MPELPEVETTRRGLLGLVGQQVERVVIRDRRLREPVRPDLEAQLVGARLEALERRAKYLLFRMSTGTLLVHLGMSGSLQRMPSDSPPGRHDHADLWFSGGELLRLHDPRRFGLMAWSEPPGDHARLAALGPEPLGSVALGPHLFEASRGRRIAVRDFLLDGRVIAGIGNIYANESLYCAGIDPRRPAGRIGAVRYQRLAHGLVATLERALAAGGTTLRDFRGGDGRPGYFQQTLAVYGRRDAPCPACGARIRQVTLGARSAFFCGRCQS